MKLSDYCTIERDGSAWIDIDTGWKFHCTLHGMEAEYAKLFIRRLSKKRRLDDEDDLLEAEVTVPDMETQRLIVEAVKTAFEMWMGIGALREEYDQLRQLTGEAYYDETQKYMSNMLGEMHDYRYMLIDQLMGI